MCKSGKLFAAILWINDRSRDGRIRPAVGFEAQRLLQSQPGFLKHQGQIENQVLKPTSRVSAQLKIPITFQTSKCKSK
mgnify:CR=1 FL=1